jgi:carbon starvation protein
VTCPECGTAHDLSSLCASVPLCLRASASPFNPFRYLATTHGATLFAVVTAALLAAIPPAGADWSLANAGKGGLILWPLFGATNQLLAGFAFVVITAWLIVTGRPWRFAVVPGVIMLAIPAAAMTWQAFIGNESNPSWLAQGNWLLASIAVATLALEAWLLIETFAHWRRNRPLQRLTGASKPHA